MEYTYNGIIVYQTVEFSVYGKHPRGKQFLGTLKPIIYGRMLYSHRTMKTYQIRNIVEYSGNGNIVVVEYTTGNSFVKQNPN